MIRVVVHLLATNFRFNRSLRQTMDGHILHCGIISLCRSVATSQIVKRFWSLVRSAIASFIFTVF